MKLPNFIHIKTPNAEIWRHIDFSRWRPRLLNSSSGFLFVDVTVVRNSMSISKPNFVHMSQFMIALLTTSGLEKNKRPPYWNPNSGFDFDYVTAIGLLFCTRLPNFIQIGNTTSCRFSRWRPRPLNTTPGFVFVDVAAFRRSKSVSKANFIDIISIHGWDITTSGLHKQTSAILEF